MPQHRFDSDLVPAHHGMFPGNPPCIYVTPLINPGKYYVNTWLLLWCSPYVYLLKCSAQSIWRVICLPKRQESIMSLNIENDFYLWLTCCQIDYLSPDGSLKVDVTDTMHQNFYQILCQNVYICMCVNVVKHKDQLNKSVLICFKSWLT